MNASARALGALAAIDLKSVGRDSFLRWMTAFSVVSGLIVRWGIPALAEAVQSRYGYDIRPYYPLLTGFLLALMPMLAGLVIGFLLLDQKDDQTLSALQVTPLTLEGYLAWRIASPMVAAIVLTVVVILLADLIPMDFLPLLAMAIGVSPLAPFFALFLAAFAGNKVQGMALTKVNGVFTMPPVVAWFVTGPWHWAFGLVPTFWPCKAMWRYAEGEGDYLLYLGVGFVFLSGCLWWMLKRFLAVMVR